jgi:hypothetical protein
MTVEERTQGDYYFTLPPKQQQQSWSHYYIQQVTKFTVKGETLLIN